MEESRGGGTRVGLARLVWRGGGRSRGSQTLHRGKQLEGGISRGPVAGKYSVGAVESQMWVQGAADTEVWLGVKLARSKGSVIGWMPSGKLQRLVGEDN